MFSVSRLTSVFSITESEAILVRAIISLELSRGDRVRLLEDASPSYEVEHDSPSRKLYMINRLLEGFHGVEIIRSKQDDMHKFRGISYLNAGDAYAATIMYDHGKRKWLLGCWGDIMESPRASRRFE